MGVRLAGSSFEATQARYVAEAGLEHERWRLNRAGCVAYTNLPSTALGNDTYSATVASTSGSPVAITGIGTLVTGASHQLRRSGVPIFGDLRTDSIRPSSGGIRDTYLADGALSNAAFGGSPDLVLSDTTSVDRALIRFDLSNLPTTTRVTSAILELELEDIAFGGAGSARVHRATDSWTESEATWNERRSGATWTTPGGDYDPQIEASTDIDVAQLGSTQWDVTPLTASWVRGTNPNRGLLLAVSPGIDGASFSSGDRVCGQHPRLTVTYSCECGQPCQLVEALGQNCAWDSLPNTNAAEFSTAGGGDVWDITFLPECVTFNAVAAPADGAWLGVDYTSSTAYMVDTAGNLLTSFVLAPAARPGHRAGSVRGVGRPSRAGRRERSSGLLRGPRWQRPGLLLDLGLFTAPCRRRIHPELRQRDLRWASRDQQRQGQVRLEYLGGLPGGSGGLLEADDRPLGTHTGAMGCRASAWN